MSKFKRREFLKSSSLLTGGLLLGTATLAFSNDNQTEFKNKDCNILDAIMNRRSVRNYASTPVPEEHIKMILEAARMAATSGNQQPWKFIVTKDPATIAKLKDACISSSVDWFKKNRKPNQEELKNKISKTTEYYNKCFSAPVYITILTDKESKYPTYNHWDGPLAAANLMIAARSLGYGTVHYTDSVRPAVTKNVLNIPDRYERVCFTPVGIPIEWPEMPSKKDYESFIIKDSF